MPIDNTSKSRPKTIILRQASTQDLVDGTVVLLPGEPVLETSTGMVKYGDGSSQWKNLPYFGNTKYAGMNQDSPYWRATMGGTVTWQAVVPYVVSNSIDTVFIAEATVTSNGSPSYSVTFTTSTVTPSTGDYVRFNLDQASYMVVGSVTINSPHSFTIALQNEVSIPTDTVLDIITSKPAIIKLNGRLPDPAQDGERVVISSSFGNGTGDFALESTWYLKSTAVVDEFEIYYDKDMTEWQRFDPNFDVGDESSDYIANSGQITYDDYKAAASAVDYDSNGNLFVAGTTSLGWGCVSRAPFLAKYDKAGVRLWHKTFEGYHNGFGYGMAVDLDGNAFLTLEISNGGAGCSDAIGLLKIDGLTGDILWQKKIDSFRNEYAYTVDVDSKGNAVLVGVFNICGDDEVFVMKVRGKDSDALLAGSIIWQVKIGDHSGCAYDQVGTGLAIGSDDSIVIAGTSFTWKDTLLVMKLTGDGQLVWQKKVPAPDWCDDSTGADVAIDSLGNIYVIGSYEVQVDATARYVAGFFKMNQNGSIMWAAKVGPSFNGQYFSEVGVGIAIDSEDNLFVSGATLVNTIETNQFDMFVASVDTVSGTLNWVNRLGDSFKSEFPGTPDWNATGGQYIAVSGDFVSVCGAQYVLDAWGYPDNYCNDWAPGRGSYSATLFQLPKDGSELNIGGARFEPIRLDHSCFTLCSHNTYYEASEPSPLLTSQDGCIVATEGSMYCVLTAVPSSVQHVYDFADNGVLYTPSIELTSEPFVDSEWIGDEVHFVRHNFHDEVDEIDEGLGIGRNSYDGGILNIHEDDYENGYNYWCSYNGEPAGTEWNMDGWSDLTDVKDRYYTTWWKAIDRSKRTPVNKELVMHDTINDKYYTVKFLSWEDYHSGGGFSYVRREINTSIMFNRPDDSSSDIVAVVDRIDIGLALARDGGGFIFNADTSEDGSDEDYSPQNTLWNTEGWNDMSNVVQREYLPFYNVMKRQVGKEVVGRELIMWDTNNNKYYAIKFSRWQIGSNNGGPDYPGFSYVRKQIDTSRPNAGIRFSDGTVQKTAYNSKSAGIIPQVRYDDSTDRYLTLNDMGKHILVSQAYTCIIVPDYGTTEFPIGTEITIVNVSGQEVYIDMDNDREAGTIHGAGTSDTSCCWILPDGGGGNVAKLLKIRQYDDGCGNMVNEWMLSAPGISIRP